MTTHFVISQSQGMSCSTSAASNIVNSILYLLGFDSSLFRDNLKAIGSFSVTSMSFGKTTTVCFQCVGSLEGAVDNSEPFGNSTANHMQTPWYLPSFLQIVTVFSPPNEFNSSKVVSLRSNQVKSLPSLNRSCSLTIDTSGFKDFNRLCSRPTHLLQYLYKYLILKTKKGPSEKLGR